MKANDFRFSGYSEKEMGNFIEKLNVMLDPRKVVWSNDLDYVFEKEMRNIYTEKQKQLGMDSLFILVDVKKNPWAIFQNRKLIGKGDTKYSTVTAMLSHADKYNTPFTWLVIKNPVLERFGGRKRKLENMHYEREQTISEATGKATRDIKQQLAAVKKAAVDTLLEYDNFFFIAERFAKRIAAGDDEEVMLEKYFNTDPDIDETPFRYNFRELVKYFKKRLGLKIPDKNKVERNERKRESLAEFISENKKIPYEKSAAPSSVRRGKLDVLRDASGYVVDLTKYIVKRADNFKNSENAIVQMVKDLETEFNDFIKLATEKINEAITTDDWRTVKPWASGVTELQPDIFKLVTKELPAKSADDYGYRREMYVSQIAESLKDLRDTKKELVKGTGHRFW
jgi:hypothetical protein